MPIVKRKQKKNMCSSRREIILPPTLDPVECVGKSLAGDPDLDFTFGGYEPTMPAVPVKPRVKRRLPGVKLLLELERQGLL